MTDTEIAEIVASMTWRPGTRLTYVHGTAAMQLFGTRSHCFVILAVHGPNSDDPSQTIDLSAPIRLPSRPETREELIEAVKVHVLDWWDRHESAEWFKVDGKRVTDLHPARAAGLPPAEAAQKERRDAQEAHEKARRDALDRMLFGPDDPVSENP